MPGSATRTPIQVRMLGRSPSETPTNTGTRAAPTPDTGATTPIRPRARPRYKKTVPTALPRPAISAHAKSARRAWPGRDRPTASIASPPAS